MKILLIGRNINPPWVEGLKNSVFYLAKSLAKLGHDVTILTTYNEVEQKNAEKIKFEYVKCSDRLFPLKCFFLIHLFKKFDIIHYHSHIFYYLDSLVSIPAKIAKKPFILTCYSTKTNRLPKVSKILVLFVSHIVVISNRLKKLFDDASISSSVVPIGVNLNEYKPLPNKQELRRMYNMNEKTILYVGHLSKERGIFELLDVLAKTDLKLIICWNGIANDKEQFFKKIEELNLKNKIILKKGEIKNLVEMYNACDAYVLPLSKEFKTISIPLTILEAMACGAPVISTNAGAIPELLHEEQIAEGEEDLIYKINKVLTDEELKEKLIKKQYEKIKQYSWEEIARDHLKIYNTLHLTI